MNVMTIILTSFLSAIGAGILTLIVLCIKWLIRKITADQVTLKALAHDSFFRMCRYVRMNGEMTESELENINFLYKGYKAQGLNGTGDKLYEECMDLPITKTDLSAAHK